MRLILITYSEISNLSNFARDFLGNVVYLGGLSQFIVLTHSLISSGAAKSLQLMIKNLHPREEVWFGFPQAAEGMGCGSLSSRTRALIPVSYWCVNATSCALLILAR